MNGLHVDSVIKSFANEQLLNNVFLFSKVGDIVGLLGRNGSGKSTLLKIIFGSMTSERKFVRADSKLLKGVTDAYSVISYLPQENFIPGFLSVKAAINLYCNMPNASIISEEPMIKPFLNKKCKTLSGGEIRFLEILIVIYSSSTYVLLDEPFNGIAPLYKEEIKKHIRNMSRQKAFIITDHDYRNILDVASQVVLIHEGATRPIKDKEELIFYGYLPSL